MSENAFEEVRPAEVESYLRVRAWKLQAVVASGSIWSRSDAREDLDVFVPREPEFADYPRRLRELVRVLSEVEERSTAAVVADLVAAAADVIRFRLTQVFGDDSVRLGDAMQLFQRAREALRAAAWATVEPRPFYGTKAPPKVEAYLGEVRLGQTERGSFVVPVISPLGSVEPREGEVVDRADEPFGRFVTHRFAESLKALDEAVRLSRAKDELTPFVAAVPVGVSANLCTAIGGIAETGAAAATGTPGAPTVDVTLAWSPSRPVPPGVTDRFALAPADASILSDAAAFLRALTPQRRITISGHVIRLERGEDQPDGTIGIKGDVDGVERIVAVRLKPIAYALALHAHERGDKVTCSGVLDTRDALVPRRADRVLRATDSFLSELP